MKMGTNQEAESEPEAKQIAEETGPTEEEKETPAEHPQDVPPPEDIDPLNTYKWHTGAKAATLDGTRGDGGVTASTTIEKVEKTSTTRWSNKMQNWRKALSEDPGERASTVGRGGETPRLEKNPASRKNPFRRAQSEPPGSLFTTQSPSSSAQATSGPGASAEESEPSPTDTPQKGGGGALFRKYIRTVSQKLKRPRLLSRNSTSTLLQGEGAECTPHHCLVI